jgi:hypothetical protein
VPFPFETKGFIFAEPFDVILYATANVHNISPSIQYSTIFYCCDLPPLLSADDYEKALIIGSFSRSSGFDNV